MGLTLITLAFLVILILGHELGHFLAAKLMGIRVDEFGIGFPPRVFAKQFGETKYSLNLLPFGGFVKIHGEDTSSGVAIEEPSRSYASQPLYKKVIVIVAGVIMNFVIGWAAFAAVLNQGIPQGVVIESVALNSPAELAGLSPGELIEGFSTPEELVEFIDANRGQEIVLNELRVTPRVEFPEGEGSLGISVLPSGIEKMGLFSSISRGFQVAANTMGAIFVALGSFIWGVLSGNFDVLSDVSGPVGVFTIVRDASSLGFVYLVQLLGLISLNLAVLNIIPFPALDGGRLLFVFLQKLFGEKRITRKLEVFVNVAGFAFLILLMIVVTIKDIISL